MFFVGILCIYCASDLVCVVLVYCALEVSVALVSLLGFLLR